MSDDRKLPSPGDRIQVASDPFGRVNGEWLDATVTSVSDDGKVIVVDAERAGLEDETLPASIGATSTMWRHPAKD